MSNYIRTFLIFCYNNYIFDIFLIFYLLIFFYFCFRWVAFILWWNSDEIPGIYTIFFICRYSIIFNFYIRVYFVNIRGRFLSEEFFNERLQK